MRDKQENGPTERSADASESNETWTAPTRHRPLSAERAAELLIEQGDDDLQEFFWPADG
jgi:hypothetical protein